MYNIISFKYIHTRRSAFMYLLMAIYERDKRKERERERWIDQISFKEIYESAQLTRCN